jgi:predicted translin family RNA/ssDNA-binding protein
MTMMEQLKIEDLERELREKNKTINDQRKLIDILRESNNLVKLVDQKAIDERERIIKEKEELINQLREKIKKQISLTV